MKKYGHLFSLAMDEFMKNEGGGSMGSRGADDCPATSPSLVSSSHVKIEPTGVINLRVERRSPPLPPPPPPLLPICPIPVVPHRPPPPVIQPNVLVQHCLPLAMPGPSTSRMGSRPEIYAGPSRPVPHINMVPDLRAIPLSHRLQADEEDTSGDTENDSLDDSSSSTSNSDIRSPNGTLLVCPDQEMLPVDLHQHVEKLNEELKNLRLKVIKQQRQIRALRSETKSKTKEIDQIKDLNIKLQIELEKCRQSVVNNSTYTYRADHDSRITFPHGITLSPYNLKDLECCEIGEKGDSAFILKLLLALYSREDLRQKSITGKPSRNKKYVQDTGDKFSPEKLQFIKDKFRERVVLENTLPTELEKRCRDERVHKIINTKIQNLKRKRLNF